MKRLSKGVAAKEPGARMRGIGTTGILALALLISSATDGTSKKLTKADRAKSATTTVSASDSSSRSYTLRYYGGPRGLAWQVPRRD